MSDELTHAVWRESDAILENLDLFRNTYEHVRRRLQLPNHKQRVCLRTEVVSREWFPRCGSLTLRQRSRNTVGVRHTAR